ncbi:MAG TPA: hypothetical protein VLL52_21995, partial [Anaerolineae bacterium]|nr:hypothetical protein [Anaerolineae bacterium]
MGEQDETIPNDFPEDGDMEDAMAWLEQLAAQQGAPLDELPSITGDGAKSKAKEAVGDSAEAEPSADDVPDWVNFDPTSIDMDDLGLGGDDLGLDLSMMEEEEAVPGDVPAWIKNMSMGDGDEPPAEAAPVESGAGDDDLNWLEQVAAGEEEGVEEPPTVAWADLEADDGMVPSLAGPDMGQVNDDLDLDSLDLGDAVGASLEADGGGVGDVPEDMDDAMAWLEQLAANQGAPLDELPTVMSMPTDETPTIDEATLADTTPTAPVGIDLPSEPELEIPDLDASLAEMDGGGDDIGDIPDDMDDAMAWLEQLAARQGAPLDELPTVDSVPTSREEPATMVGMDMDGGDDGDSFDADLTSMLADLAEESAEDEPIVAEAAGDEVELDMSDFGMSDLDGDLFDSMLDSMSEDADDEEPVAEEPVAEAEVEAGGDDIGDIPDDMDDAMAWLEQLAARQGAPLDELPTVDSMPVTAASMEETASAEEMASAEADLELPDFDDSLFEEMGLDTEELVVEELVVEEPVAEEPGEEPVAEEPVVAEAEVEAGGDDIGDIPDDMDDAMAWLEQLAARQGAPLDELPTVDSMPVMAASMEETASAEEMASAEADLELPDFDDSLFEEMGLDAEELVVEELVAEEPVAEEPVVEEPVAEEPVVAEAGGDDIGDIPDDMDDAMAWLEQLAARQGAPLDELPTVDSRPAMAAPTEEAAAEAPMEAELELPDFDDSLFEGMDLGVDEPVAEEPAVAEPVMEEPVAEEPVAEAEVEAGGDDIGDIPDDMDDAMAWLEQLAARQGAPLDELPTVDSRPA